MLAVKIVQRRHPWASYSYFVFTSFIEVYFKTRSDKETILTYFSCVLMHSLTSTRPFCLEDTRLVQLGMISRK